MSKDWQPAVKAEDVTEDEPVTVDIKDQKIAIFKVDGEYYATQDTCTHAEASLSEGDVWECAVECPLHAAEFDLATGRPSGPPAIRRVRTQAVSVVDGEVVVHVGTPRSG